MPCGPAAGGRDLSDADDKPKDAKASEPREADAAERKDAEAAGPAKARAAGSKPERRPVLTEKQRIEARRRRQARRRRSHQGNVLSRGLRATGHELKRTAVFLGRSVAAGIAALGPVGGWIRAGIAQALAAALAVLRAAARAAKLAATALGRLLAALDRLITPRRGLLLTAAVAAVLLAVSQFTDFRATEIGQPGYTGIEDVATAPRVDVSDPIGSHSVLLLVAAALALGAAVGAAATGRRGFGLALAVVGGASLIVTLAIDLPNGLDAGDAAISYSGVTTVLLSGFWLELGAAGALTVTGLLLPLNPPDRDRAAKARPGGPSRGGSSARRTAARVPTAAGVLS